MAGAARKVRAGRAFVEVNGDDTGLQRALRRSSVRLKAFGAGVTKIGAGILAMGAGLAAPFVAATAIFAKVGDQLDKASARTGLSVEALSELGFAAERSGSSMEDVEKVVRRLSVSIRGGVQGLKTYTDAFDDLGLDAKKLEDLSPEDQFIAVAEALSNIEHPGKRAALAVQLLGKGGAQLLPLMNGGAAGIEALREEARKLGLTIDTETATSAAELTDAMGDLKSQITAVAVAVGSAVGPQLTKVIRLANPIIASLIRVIKLNKPLVAGIAAVAAVAIVAGAALVFLGGTITLAGIALGGIASMIGVLLGPVALAIAAVIALGVAVLKYTSLGGRALGVFRSAWQRVGPEVMAVIGAIRAALAAGDIAAALGVVTASLRVIWLAALDYLHEKWADTKRALLGGFVEFWGSVQNIWSAAGANLAEIWVRVAAAFENAWAGSVDWVAARLLELQGLADESFDSDAAKEILRENSRRDRERRDERLAADLAGIEKKFEDKVAGQLGRNDDAQKLLDAAREAERGTRGAELDAARQKLAEAIRAAHKARDDAKAAVAIPDGLKDASDSLKQKIATLGQFGGGGLAQAVGGGRNEELEQAKATAKNTRRTADAIARLETRLAFS